MTKMNVLIVEDDRDSAESLRRVLMSRTDVNYSAVTVGTLKAALECLSADNIDAVLLDLSLPDAHGVDVVRRIVNASDKVAIVVLTGWGGPDIQDSAKAAGADDVLVKPAAPKEVSEKLSYFVIKRRHDEESHAIEKLLDELSQPIVRVREAAQRGAEKIQERQPDIEATARKPSAVRGESM